LEYCNSKHCLKLTTCKWHVVNAEQGFHNIVNYKEAEKKTVPCERYESIPCKACKRDKPIYSKDMCKSCYYGEKYRNGEYSYPKSRYKPTGGKRGKKKIPENKEREILIKNLREQGKSFKEIGAMLGLSRQRAWSIYKEGNNV